MATFRLYGASPTELAAQQRFYDEFYTRTAEANRQAATQAAIQNAQLEEQARRADEAAQERQYQHGVNRLQLYLSDQDRQRNDELRAKELAIQQMHYAPGEREFADLTRFAGVLSPDQINTLAPGIPPVRRAGLTAFAAQAAKERADAETDRQNREIANATKINWANFKNIDEAKKAGIVTPGIEKYVPIWIETARNQTAQAQVDQLNSMLGTAIEKRIAQLQQQKQKGNAFAIPEPASAEDYAKASMFEPASINNFIDQIPQLDARVRFDSNANRFVLTSDTNVSQQQRLPVTAAPAPGTGPITPGSLLGNAMSKFSTSMLPPVTATNPKTGERMVYKDGKWQKM